jgi:hypothetical protein
MIFIIHYYHYILKKNKSFILLDMDFVSTSATVANKLSELYGDYQRGRTLRLGQYNGSPGKQMGHYNKNNVKRLGVYNYN